MSLKIPKPATKLSPTLLTENQNRGIGRLFESDSTLFCADMGFGKTIVTLTALAELLEEGVIGRVLIVGPLKVVNTVWRQEAAKWSHTERLTFAIATGTPAQRCHAIESDAQIVLINFENLAWACKHYKNNLPFDGLVIDELSKLKNSGGAGFKALRHRLHVFKWRAGLTGTPVSEDFEGLYGMTFVLDSGERLGTRKDLFMRRYFFPTDYNEYNWELIDPTGVTLLDKVKDLIFVADNAAYKETLPAIVHKTVPVILDSKSRVLYEAMKIDAVIDDITADNAAVVVGKLAQICSGWLYREDEPTLAIHEAKLDALDAMDLSGNVVIAYWYKEDLARLEKRYPAGVTFDGSEKMIQLWNTGKIKMLFIQPRSAGHGLQLEKGGNTLIWYSPVWSRDLTEQTEARIWRQGQKHTVNVYTLCVADSIESEMMKRVDGKGGYAELLAAHLG